MATNRGARVWSQQSTLRPDSNKPETLRQIFLGNQRDTILNVFYCKRYICTSCSGFQPKPYWTSARPAIRPAGSLRSTKRNILLRPVCLKSVLLSRSGPARFTKPQCTRRFRHRCHCSCFRSAPSLHSRMTHTSGKAASTPV